MSFTKLLAYAVWWLALFGAFSIITALLNAPSTPAVVFGVLVGVSVGWALYHTAKILWRMK